MEKAEDEATQAKADAARMEAQAQATNAGALASMTVQQHALMKEEEVCAALFNSFALNYTNHRKSVMSCPRGQSTRS